MKVARAERARAIVKNRWHPTVAVVAKRASRPIARCTAAQAAAIDDLLAAADGIQGVRTRSAPVRTDPLQRVSDSANRLVAAEPAPSLDRVQGSRLVDMGLLDEALAPLLTCPQCHAVGTLFCSREHERRAGLASSLQWCCTACDVPVLKVWTSPPLPRKPEQKGPSLRQINAQLVTGAVHAGLGRSSSQLFTSILDVPAPSFNAWDRVTKEVYPAMEAGGHASAKAALVEERVEALAAGVLPDEKGETPIVISIDARWPKRGRANNSLDGYMAAIGTRTGKVVDFTFRTKVGTRKNWSRASKAMEPDMGVEIVDRINSESNGAWVEGVCMDLDASTRAHICTLCEERGWPEPRTLHDLNHFIKCVKGAFIKIKTGFSGHKVFTADTQLRLASQMALMIHQQRTSYASVADLEASLLQVVEHAFDKHTHCNKWFSCPCTGASRRVASNYNKDGAWLSERGGQPLKLALVALVKKIVRDHGAGLMHLADTQGNEAFNGLSACVMPKSLCVAFSDAGPGRLGATVTRYNSGVREAVRDTFERVQIGMPVNTDVALRMSDATRARHTIRKKSLRGKSLRKRAKTTRKERTQREAEEGDDAQYASGMCF